jgi:ubiquinone/menaquinone biosynthesis C-methylase UbiE
MPIVQRYIIPYFIFYVFEPMIKNCFRKIASNGKRYLSNPIIVICSGTGGQCVCFHKLSIKSIGIDINFNLLSFSKNRYPDIPFVCCDAGKLPFKQNVFKGVVFSFALHDKTPQLREQFIIEAKRVSASGGYFAITDIGIPKNLIEKISHMVTIVSELFSGHYFNGIDFLKRGTIEKIASQHNLSIGLRFPNGLRNAETVFLQKL